MITSVLLIATERGGILRRLPLRVCCGDDLQRSVWPHEEQIERLRNATLVIPAALIGFFLRANHIHQHAVGRDRFPFRAPIPHVAFRLSHVGHAPAIETNRPKREVASFRMWSEHQSLDNTTDLTGLGPVERAGEQHILLRHLHCRRWLARLRGQFVGGRHVFAGKILRMQFDVGVPEGNANPIAVGLSRNHISVDEAEQAVLDGLRLSKHLPAFPHLAHHHLATWVFTISFFSEDRPTAHT